MPEAIEGSMQGKSFGATNVTTAMDPRLQRLVAKRSRGVRLEATASSEVDEVAVLAKVTNPTAWAATSEVRASAVIGSMDSEDGTSIVTGRIPAVRIEAEDSGPQCDTGREQEEAPQGVMIPCGLRQVAGRRESIHIWEAWWDDS